jgi:predicted peptidase
MGLAACSVSVSVSAPPSGALPPDALAPAPLKAGKTVIPPLSGQAATNQAAFLETLRSWPKQVPSEARMFTEPGRTTVALRYYLFKPPGQEATKAYPLVLSLHGGKPKQFEHLLEGGELGFAYGLGRLVSPAEQAKHPAFVAAPWSDGRGWTEDNLRRVVGLVEALRREFNIDATRLYVTGQSMGGYGAWAVLAKQPTLFAAAIPVCGGGDPSSAIRFKHVPVWAFHGSADRMVPVSESQSMVAALLKAGGQPIYWEYEGATHAQTAERAYCEPQLLDWLFAQQRR